MLQIENVVDRECFSQRMFQLGGLVSWKVFSGEGGVERRLEWLEIVLGRELRDEVGDGVWIRFFKVLWVVERIWVFISSVMGSYFCLVRSFFVCYFIVIIVGVLYFYRDQYQLMRLGQVLEVIVLGWRVVLGILLLKVDWSWISLGQFRVEEGCVGFRVLDVFFSLDEVDIFFVGRGGYGEKVYDIRQFISVVKGQLGWV